jgi:histidinol-phosphate aminotransferase
MSRFWSPIVHTLTPYVPGEQPKVTNLLKLNTNESPYAPSPKVLEAIHSATDDTLRLYPDPNAEALKQTLADYHHLQADQVFVGNGSDEVLAHTFQALLKQDQPLLFPDITYSFYPVYCGLYEIDYRTVALNDRFEIDIADYQGACGGIIFPNPNAPTGCLLNLGSIEALLQAQPDVVVVIDEAYIDFGGQSAATLINRYPNLLVIQTLSKSRALAGLRVGFALGQAPLIEALERVKNSFNSYPLDRLAIPAAIAAFEDEAYFKACCDKIIATREHLVTRMQAMGFEVLPSAANFVFATHPQRSAAELAQQLREQAIIVRHFKAPRIESFLRITIGTDEQNQRLLKTLEQILD